MYAVVRVLSAVLLISAAAIAVQAAPITYTITSTGTGTLGASPFTNANITVTLTGDTSTVVPYQGGISGAVLDHGPATVTIAGLGSATLTGSIVALATNTGLFQGQSGVVIAQEDAGHPPNTSVTGILGIASPTLFGYDLQTALGPLLSTGGVANNGPQDAIFLTDRGNLVFAAGQSFAGNATFTSALVVPLVPQVGLWWNPNESGSGYAIDVKHNVLVVTIYSYTPAGAPQWYLAAGPLSADGKTFTGTLDKYQGGQCIACAYNGRPVLLGNDGAIGITFSSPTSATVTLPGGRATQIQPQAF